MATYSVLLLPDPGDGGFTVEIPCLPGVVTEGDTREDALANAKDAIALMIEDLMADGEAVPSESVSPGLTRVDIDIPSDSKPSTIQGFTRVKATA
jgi:predicted RNase H-like HicB family nuclease